MSKNEQKKSAFYNAEYMEPGTLKCLIDWCEFTLPYSLSLDDVFLYLGIPKEEFSLLENNNLLGYSTYYVSGHIKVLSDGLSDPLSMGHHVLMSGQACREWEMYNGCRWYEFLQSVFDLSGHFTRFDSAIDDFKGYFKIPSLVRKIKKGELTSKFKRCKRIEDILIKDGSTKGTTLYYGRSSSDIQIYMYEKNHEQKMVDEVPVWNRTEVRMRDMRADLFVMQLLATEDIASVTLGVVSNYLTFKDTNKKDSNKSRWKVSKFWTDFINDAEKVKLTTKKPDRSIERIREWMLRQVKKSAAIMSVTDAEFLNDLASQGFEDIDSKDEALIDSYLKQQQLLTSATFDKRVALATNLTAPRTSDSGTLVSIYNKRDSVNNVFTRQGVRSESELHATLHKMKNHSTLSVKHVLPVQFIDKKTQKKDTP